MKPEQPADEHYHADTVLLDKEREERAKKWKRKPKPIIKGDKPW